MPTIIITSTENEDVIAFKLEYDVPIYLKRYKSDKEIGVIE